MRHRTLASGLIVAVAALGCETSSLPVAPTADQAGSLDDASFAHGSLPRDASFNQQLAQLRRATARFHRVEVAVSEGYGPITPCIEDPALGAQGIHYGKGSLIADGTVSLTEPEILTYEPGPGGLTLVGVEYIVPFGFVPADAPPPTLLGRDFHANMALGLWALHVWPWRHNPSGMFADWNPKVSC